MKNDLQEYEYIAEMTIGVDTAGDSFHVVWGVNPKGKTAPTEMDVLEGVGKDICRAKCLAFYLDVSCTKSALLVTSHIQGVIVNKIFKNTNHKPNTEPLCPHGEDWDECPECCH